MSAQINDDADEVVVGGVSSEGGSGDAMADDRSETVIQIELAPACNGNHPGSGGEEYQLCDGAVTSCPPSATGDQQVLMWRWSRHWSQATNTAVTEWEVQAPICLSWDEIEVPNTPLLVLREFQERAKLLHATVRIQPPAGRTLVNFDTIFYADDPSTIVNGIPIAYSSVDLEINATTYNWHFGDGATITTTAPGRPYPDHDISHRYAATQTINPRVDVTYTGRYRVDGGAWLDIPGTATVTGEDVPLTVVAARSELIAG